MTTLTTGDICFVKKNGQFTEAIFEKNLTRSKYCTVEIDGVKGNLYKILDVFLPTQIAGIIDEEYYSE